MAASTCINFATFVFLSNFYSVKYLLFFALFFALGVTCAQNKMLDSLWNDHKRSGQRDSSLLKTMGLITHNYAFIDADTGRILSLAMIEKARGLKLVKYEGIGYNSLGVNYMYMDSNSKALACFWKCHNLSKSIGDKSKMAACFMNMGLVYTNLTDHRKALEYKLKSLKLRQEVGDKKGMGNSYANLGITYAHLNDNSKAIDAYLKSLKIAEENRDKNLVANNLNNIGIIYKTMADYTNALAYFEKSRVLKMEMGNKRSLANTYTNMADVYYDLGQFDRSMNFYTKGYELHQEIGNRRGVANSLSCIAVYYQNLPDSAAKRMSLGKRDRVTRALDHSGQAYKINETIGDKSAMCIDLNNMASAYFELGQLAKAEQMMDKVLVMAIETEQLNRQRDAWLTLSDIYEKTGRAGKALIAYKKSIQLDDSLQSEEKHDEITRLQVQYEYGKKATADSVKNAAQQEVKDAEILAQQAQLKQEKTQRFALYGGLILLLAFGVFAYNRFKVTQKQKSIIENQKHLVEEKQKEILDSIHYAKRIQSSLMPTDKYVEKVISRLKNKG